MDKPFRQFVVVVSRAGFVPPQDVRAALHNAGYAQDEYTVMEGRADWEGKSADLCFRTITLAKKSYAEFGLYLPAPMYFGLAGRFINDPTKPHWMIVATKLNTKTLHCKCAALNPSGGRMDVVLKTLITLIGQTLPVNAPVRSQ